jgi:hypothetical protein
MQHTSFNQLRPLTEDELRSRAPSVFAQEAHESRSDRFVAVPTIDLIRGLEREGFHPVYVMQGRSRIPGKSNYTKHMVRFRRFDDVARYQVGDTIAETVLTNANDGTSRYKFFAGLFRIACLNGMIVHKDTLSEVSVSHSGKEILPKVIEGTYQVLGEAQLALEAPDQWSQIKLNREASMALAEAAHELRFGEAPIGEAIKPEQLLLPRRIADRGDDLWTRFNVVQEHVMRGGDHGVTRDANNHRRNTSTRAINNVSDNVRLNRALWMVGERLAETLRSAG